MSYKPGYDEKAIKESSKVPNISGKSPQENLHIEEANQRAVAESQNWLLAREHNGVGDSRQDLQDLGFAILGEEDLFYKINPPAGWTKETSGFWTSVKDASGTERISHFFKGAWYDTRAFLNIKA